VVVDDIETVDAT